MNILFVENRQQTFFWQEIAARLARDGHEIHWIVQNRHFSPKVGVVHAIPYPRKRDLHSFAWDLPTQKIIESDRNINYFRGTALHYKYYDDEIDNILARVRPQVVFGESTLFHELLIAKQCRQRGIHYLQATSCRYPVGRFSFFLYDSLHTYSGAGDHLPEADARAMARCIAERTVQPDYMRGSARKSVTHHWRALVNRVEMTRCFLMGERFNTPSPWVKLGLEWRLKARKRAWERLVQKHRDPDASFTVLYPLQMQPESTIDVWGHPYSDQVKLLREMLAATDPDTIILVKPNPKSYYEMTDQLLDLVDASPRLVPLPHSTSMGELLPRVNLVVTVTGTVAIEATCAGTPVASLQHSVNNVAGDCEHLASPRQLGAFIGRLRSAARAGNSSAGIRLLQALHASSFPGIISNPFTMPDCVSPDNLASVHEAFSRVLQRIQAHDLEPVPSPAPGTHRSAIKSHDPVEPARVDA